MSSMIASRFLGGRQDGRLWSSALGLNWEQIYAFPDAIAVSAIAYANRRWLVATRQVNLVRAKLYTSTDSLNWAEVPIPAVQDVTDLVYANGLWVASCWFADSQPADDQEMIDNVNDRKRMMWSGDDGATWNLVAVPYDATVAAHNQNGPRVVVENGGIWIAVGDGVEPLRSTDGKAWSVPDPDIRGFDGVYANGVFATVHRYGRIFWSSDGLTWSSLPLDAAAADLRSIAYSQGRWCHVTSADRVLTSTTIDGPYSLVPDSYAFHKLIEREDRIYAVGDRIAGISRDGGQTWETGTIPSYLLAEIAGDPQHGGGADAAVQISVTGAVRPPPPPRNLNGRLRSRATVFR